MNQISSLFQGITFYIQPIWQKTSNSSSQPIQRQELIDLVRKYGGKISYTPTNPSVTHIILGSFDRPIKDQIVSIRQIESRSIEWLNENGWSNFRLIENFGGMIMFFNGNLVEFWDKEKVVLKKDWLFDCIALSKVYGEGDSWNGWRIRGKYHDNTPKKPPQPSEDPFPPPPFPPPPSPPPPSPPAEIQSFPYAITHIEGNSANGQDHASSTRSFDSITQCRIPILTWSQKVKSDSKDGFEYRYLPIEPQSSQIIPSSIQLPPDPRKAFKRYNHRLNTPRDPRLSLQNGQRHIANSEQIHPPDRSRIPTESTCYTDNKRYSSSRPRYFSNDDSIHDYSSPSPVAQPITPPCIIDPINPQIWTPGTSDPSGSNFTKSSHYIPSNQILRIRNSSYSYTNTSPSIHHSALGLDLVTANRPGQLLPGVQVRSSTLQDIAQEAQGDSDLDCLDSDYEEESVKQEMVCGISNGFSTKLTAKAHISPIVTTSGGSVTDHTIFPPTPISASTTLPITKLPFPPAFSSDGCMTSPSIVTRKRQRDPSLTPYMTERLSSSKGKRPIPMYFDACQILAYNLVEHPGASEQCIYKDLENTYEGRSQNGWKKIHWRNLEEIEEIQRRLKETDSKRI